MGRSQHRRGIRVLLLDPHASSLLLERLVQLIPAHLLTRFLRQHGRSVRRLSDSQRGFDNQSPEVSQLLAALPLDDVRDLIWPLVREHYGDAHAHVPLLPQADLDPGAKGDARAAGYSCALDVCISSSAGVVVRDNLPCVSCRCFCLKKRKLIGSIFDRSEHVRPRYNLN